MKIPTFIRRGVGYTTVIVALVLAAAAPANATHCILPDGLPKMSISGASGGFMGFGVYIPRRIYRLEELPTIVRAKLDDYLQDWLDDSTRSTARFMGGQFANKEDFLRAYPVSADRAKSLEWKNFTYNLLFEMSAPDKGIESFVAGIHLGPQGEVMLDLQYPPTGKNPDVRRLAPLKDVYALAKQKGFDLARTTGTLKYNDIDQRLFIDLLEPFECDGNIAKFKGITIDAHDGHFITEFEQGSSHGMPSPF